MGRTWKPTTAGILSIIGGIVGVAGGIAMAVLGTALMGLGLPSIIPLNVELISIPLTILGIVAIIGGMRALKRKTWGMALAGSICALFPVFPLGLLAIIFVAMGKKEFA